MTVLRGSAVKLHASLASSRPGSRADRRSWPRSLHSGKRQRNIERLTGPEARRRSVTADDGRKLRAYPSPWRTKRFRRAGETASRERIAEMAHSTGGAEATRSTAAAGARRRIAPEAGALQNSDTTPAQEISRFLTAYRIKSGMLCRPSFCKIWPRCVSTVVTPILSRFATSLFARPSASNCRISRSRSVRRS